LPLKGAKTMRKNYNPLLDELRSLQDPPPPWWMVIILWLGAIAFVIAFWGAVYGCMAQVGWL
jgi:hypothetical protein